MQNPFIVAPQSLDTKMQDISAPLLNATNSLYDQQFRKAYTDSLTQESDRKRDLHPFELEKARLDNDKLESDLNVFNINLANSLDADIYQGRLYEASKSGKPLPNPRNIAEAVIYENFMNMQKSKSNSSKAPINLDIFSQRSNSNNANAKDTTKPPLDLDNIPGLIDEGKLLQFTNKTNGESFYISENELNSLSDIQKAELFGNDPEMKNYDKSETTVDAVMNSLSGYEDDKPLSINIYDDNELKKLHYIPISRNDRTTLINTDLQDQAAMSIRNSGEEDLSLDEVINKRNIKQRFKVNKDLESIINNIENGKRRYNEELKFRNEVKRYNTTVNEVINKYIKDGEGIWKGISTQTDSDARKSGTLSISKAIKDNGLGFQDFKNLAYSKSYDGDNKPIIKLNILSSMLFSDNKVRDFMLKNEPQFIKVLNESKKWLESNDIEFSSDFTNSLSKLVGDLGTAKLLAKSAAKYLTNEDKALKKAKVKLHNAKGTINRQTEGIELKLF